MQIHPIRSSWIPLYCRHLGHVYSLRVLKKIPKPALNWFWLYLSNEEGCRIRKSLQRLDLSVPGMKVLKSHAGVTQKQQYHSPFFPLFQMLF